MAGVQLTAAGVAVLELALAVAVAGPVLGLALRSSCAIARAVIGPMEIFGATVAGQLPVAPVRLPTLPYNVSKTGMQS